MLTNIKRKLFRNLSTFGHSIAPPTHTFAEFPDKSFEEIYQYSINSHEEFWGKVAKSQIKWKSEFSITGLICLTILLK